MLRSITPVEVSVLRTTVSGLRFFNPVLSVLLLLLSPPVRGTYPVRHGGYPLHIPSFQLGRIPVPTRRLIT